VPGAASDDLGVHAAVAAFDDRARETDRRIVIVADQNVASQRDSWCAPMTLTG